jgi:hypothetical protein
VSETATAARCRRSHLRVALGVEERARAGRTEPRQVVARVPVDEFVAVGRVKAGLQSA